MTGPGPTFDHRDLGTPETVWAAAGLADRAAEVSLAPWTRVVVVAAHPDDETLGAGGLIRAAAAAHLDVHVIVATLGERSHPDSKTHTPADLRRLRRIEVAAALDELAPAAVVEILGLPDGHLADHVSELAAAIAGRLTDSSTLVVAPWTGDGHPDHTAAGRAALSTGATVWQYPIWAWHFMQPPEFPTQILRLPLDPATVAAKAIALRHHESQTTPLSRLPGDEAILPPEFLAHFQRDHETFIGGPASLHEPYFDDLYADNVDPWHFSDRWYEERKRSITLASLPRRSFRSAFEPGCSIGVLTAQLAPRCERLLATDISAVPLRPARERLAASPWVIFEQRRIPNDWPSGRFDLIVLSEIGYYCSAADLAELAVRAGQSLTSDGVLVACHWRHEVRDYPQSGDEVHRVLLARSGLVTLAHHLEEDFVLDVLVPAPGVSVARAEGLS